MTNSLQHVGVLGMRWGRRTGSSEMSTSASEDHITAQKLKGKKLHEMSNAELRTLTSRMQLEQQYKTLKPSKLSRGKQTVNNILKGVGWVTTAAGTIGAAATLGKKLYDIAKSTKNV